MAVIEGAATTVNSGSPLMAGITPHKKKKRSAIDMYKEASSGINIKPSHKGLLHKDLGVPLGQPIPPAKLAAALHSPDPAVRKRAQFAQNEKSFKH